MFSTVPFAEVIDSSHSFLGQCHACHADAVISETRSQLAAANASSIEIVQRGTGSNLWVEFWLQRVVVEADGDEMVAVVSDADFDAILTRLRGSLPDKGLSPFILVFSEV